MVKQLALHFVLMMQSHLALMMDMSWVILVVSVMVPMMANLWVYCLMVHFDKMMVLMKVLSWVLQMVLLVVLMKASYWECCLVDMFKLCLAQMCWFDLAC